MEVAETWRSLFENWPENIPREGVVVTTGGESIPFKNFLISGELLLLDRGSPDASGARKVMLVYESISVVKLAAAVELSQFQATYSGDAARFLASGYYQRTVRGLLGVHGEP